MRASRPKTAVFCALVALFALGAGIAHGEISQKGKLRVKVAGKLAPHNLPRKGVAPISVYFSGQISTTDDSQPPQLKQLRIEINRNGRLDYVGLPVCRAEEIQPASTGRALAACRRSLVGQGTFWASVVFAGQAPYPTKGHLLVFRGERKGRPVLLGQIYSAHPFATSFLIPFTIHNSKRGKYGTVLNASLPSALGNWGYVTAISMKLSRRYTVRGRAHSFISAGCPAPKGFPGAIFPLARTSFKFSGGKQIASSLTKSCAVRGK
jgi:hypothetical protein